MSDDLNIVITGNPFIDSGIYALATKLDKNISDITLEDIKIESEKLSRLYTESSWKKDMYTIFPNNVLTNPASTNKSDLNEISTFNESIEIFISKLTLSFLSV